MTSKASPPAADYVFAPEERPFLPGSPYTPKETVPQRIVYGITAVFIGIGAGFPNALTTVNTGSIGGFLGLYAFEIAMLPAVFVAMNASANLTLIKTRAAFGIPRMVTGVLLLYLVAALVQLACPGFATAIATRAANGLSSAALTTLTIYYLMQLFPGAKRPLAICLGFGITQIATPLARMVPVELLANDAWLGLRQIEVASALVLLTLVWAVRLPPTDRVNAFQPLDVLSIALFVGALLPFCQVLSLGRLQWWTDTPTLGWLLALSIALFVPALTLELHRKQPLVQFRWLGSLNIIRFMGVAIMVRLALAEQTYGSVGLLTADAALNNDQLHVLFGLVAIAMVLGAIAAAATLSPERLPWQIMIAALFIAAGAALDSGSNNLTRPAQLYLSQSLIGFGTTLFIGPSLIFGILQLLQRKSIDYFITLVVLFSSTQNIGGLAGSAFLGTWQTIATRAHAQAIAEDADLTRPEVVARIQQGATAYAGVLPDPAARQAAGTSQLSQAINREANVLAFNDIFRVVMVIALAVALYLASVITVRAIAKRRQGEQTA